MARNAMADSFEGASISDLVGALPKEQRYDLIGDLIGTLSGTKDSEHTVINKIRFRLSVFQQLLSEGFDQDTVLNVMADISDYLQEALLPIEREWDREQNDQ